MARTAPLASVQKPVDLKTLVWVDYNGPLHPSSGVVVFDTFTTLFTANRIIADSVTVTDQLNLVLKDLNVADSVVISDAGVLARYDYASPDYFLTPADYVGDWRTF